MSSSATVSESSSSTSRTSSPSTLTITMVARSTCFDWYLHFNLARNRRWGFQMSRGGLWRRGNLLPEGRRPTHCRTFAHQHQEIHWDLCRTRWTTHAQKAKTLWPRRRIIWWTQEIRNKFENILKEQRRENLDQQGTSVLEDSEAIPLSAHKNFDIAIVYGHNSKVKTKAISDLTADEIGSLVQLKCIVVRVS